MKRCFSLLIALMLVLALSQAWADKPSVPAQCTLTLGVQGEGTTTPSPGSHVYAWNEKVLLSATPAAGWSFDHWEGDVTGTSNPITLRIKGDMAVTAVFTNSQATTYTLTTAVTGSGTVDPPSGTHTYNENDVVTVTATPDAGWQFDHWEGDATGSQNPVSLTMTSNKTVTAVFTVSQAPAYSLTTAVIGEGTTNPAPGTHVCSWNEKVVLSATPSEGWRFDHWEGDVTGTTNPVTLRIKSALSVTAVFTATQPPTCTLTTGVIGNGTVDPPVGTYTYNENEVVTVTAIPDTGWQFDHWEGGAAGTENPLSLTITADTSVTAVFTELPPQLTALDLYVEAPDDSFAYGPDPVNIIYGSGYTAYVWYMASQTWLTTAEVDRTLWEHWLTVIVPDTTAQDTALLYISSGSNTNPYPTSVDNNLAQLAVTTQAIVAQLRMVPNQRLKFTDEFDPRYIDIGRTEDELIAYCWDKFLRGGDAIWLPRLPMTKAAVRAMDVVQLEHPTIQDFIVFGASKRGWTTWTTAIVEPRVKAIVPMVIDILNVEPSMLHHYAAYGYWSEAIHDYEDMGIMDWFYTPEMAAMLAIIDPYSYVDRLTMPKYIMNATGDQFFLPDSSQFYFDDLQGEKYLRYVPNTDHGLNTQAWYDLAAYCLSIMNDYPRPEFSWTKEADGSLRVQTVDTPSQVLLWQATNPTARNFRLDVIGPAWTSSPLTDQGGGLYVAQVPEPAEGWTAFMVELTFPSPGPVPMTFTTEVSVVPDVLPYQE